MLEVRSLSVSYGNVRALRDVSLDVEKGSFVGLLGANGAGKSTLLRTISGLERPSSGEVRFDGHDLTAIEPHRIPLLGIAHVPEGRRVFSSMTVMDNLVMGGYTRPTGSRQREQVDKVMSIFPRLRERRSQAAGSLSGGEQQMLAIGRALMLEPALLMLDEPSLGLAPVVVDEVFTLLTEIHRELNQTIFIVEQNAAQALEVIERAVVFENGRVTFHGTREEVSGTEYVRAAYLGL
jgi:branched-chain amino acid transport system ATP-binding protein